MNHQDDDDDGDSGYELNLKEEDKLPEEELQRQRFHEIMFAKERWFQISYIHLTTMSITEAILYAFLCNWAMRKAAALKRHGWFYCVRQEVWHHLLLNFSQQQRLFNSLEARGFIESKWMKGNKWIRLKYDAVIKAYTEMAERVSKDGKAQYTEDNRRIVAGMQRLKAGDPRWERKDLKDMSDAMTGINGKSPKKRMKMAWRKKKEMDDEVSTG